MLFHNDVMIRNLDTIGFLVVVVVVVVVLQDL